jgi:hypothetical protein
MQGSNMQLNQTPEEAYNELTCKSETIMAILFEMRMDLRFKRYYWKLTKFTRQYWNETKNTYIKQTTCHLEEEQRILFSMI